jgi:hypothetical protein
VNELQTEVRNHVRPSLDSSACRHKSSAASTDSPIRNTLEQWHQEPVTDISHQSHWRHHGLHDPEMAEHLNHDSPHGPRLTAMKKHHDLIEAASHCSAGLNSKFTLLKNSLFQRCLRDRINRAAIVRP